MTRVRLSSPIVLELDGGIVLTITESDPHPIFGPIYSIRARFSLDEHPGEVKVYVDEHSDINFFMKPISSEV